MNKKKKPYRLYGLVSLALALLLAATQVFAAQESLEERIKAGSKVTWESAITSLCTEFNWVNRPSFLTCKRYAKNHNYLKSPIPSVISRKRSITLKQLTLLRQRIAGPVVASSTPQTPPTSTVSAELPQRTLPEVRITGNEASIDTNFFDSVRLTRGIPKTFYIDEVYTVEGDILRPNVSELFVFLCNQSSTCSDSTNFLGKPEGSHFKIPVHFTSPGSYKIGIILGKSGQSKIEDITVVSSTILPNDSGFTPQNPRTILGPQGTTFSWQGQGTVTHLTFFQNAARRDYLFRQPLNEFRPDSKDFAGFTPGTVHWFVSGGASATPIQHIEVTTEEFSKINSDEIQPIQFENSYPGPRRFTFQGHARKALSKKASITLPSGIVQEIIFADADIIAGQDFKVEFDLSARGTYIFEINNLEGSAALNSPVYVGNSLPLLPDFFALNPSKLSTASINSLPTARTDLLALINADRAANNLAPVTINDDLNSVAQAHSQNMATLNFFGHKNPAGESPDDRRRKAKITTPIRENLGKSTSLAHVEAGLMRSPVHRAAILDPAMRRIGLGIVKDSEGYFLVTQNFSGDPLKDADFNKIKDVLIDQSNQKRERSGQTRLNTSNLLNEIAQEWSGRMVTDSFFGGTDNRGGKIADLVRSRGITSSIQIHLVGTSDYTLLIDEIYKQGGFQNSGNHLIGIGLKANATGDLFMTTLYTP